MNIPTKIMDKTTISEMSIRVSQQFRTPLRAEKKIGLWVDRIGERDGVSKPEGLRILGLYGAVYIESGSGWFISRTSGKVRVNPGDVMILFPDEPHTYYPEGRWKETWVVWNGPGAGIFEELGFISKKNMVLRDLFSEVRGGYDNLRKIMGEEDVASILERKGIIENMILRLFKGNRGSSLKHQNANIERVISYLRKHYHAKVSIEELSRMAHLSETHFRRCFRSYTGRSPREFILSLRMTKAKQFLSGGKSIKEVAYLVGYEDVFYFMRSFKKVTGITAGRFS